MSIDERKERYAKAIVRLRGEARRREGESEAQGHLAILARGGEFHSMEGPMTGPERMAYARAVAWIERRVEEEEG